MWLSPEVRLEGAVRAGYGGRGAEAAHTVAHQRVLQPALGLDILEELLSGPPPHIFKGTVHEFEEKPEILVSPVVVSAIFVFPSHKNNVYMLSMVYCYFVWERKFLAVRRVGLMTHHEYRVDRPFPVT